MFSWFTTDSQRVVKPGEIPQISRSLGMFSAFNPVILPSDPIKEDDETLFSDSTTNTTTSSSSSLISSITGYWSSTTPSSPSRRLSITRQPSVVLNQSGELFSDLSQVPPGVEVEYVEERETQAGLWDFFNHVISGDEDETLQSKDSVSHPESGAAGHDQSLPPTGMLDSDAVLQESPRRRNSIGGGGKSVIPGTVSLLNQADPPTPVQEIVSDGDRTPVLSDPSRINPTSNQQRCILCGRHCITVHSSRFRSRSV